MRQVFFLFLSLLIIVVTVDGLVPGQKAETGNRTCASDSNQSIMLLWNTFLGGNGREYGFDIITDDSGNIYVTGFSTSSWGNPLNPYSGDYDAFAAKLNANGILQWNTFLGGSSGDWSRKIARDGSGNIYIIGWSYGAWGNPLNPYGGGLTDAFVAKLDPDGVLQWSTFLGGSNFDWGMGIAVDGSGNIYVTGRSFSTWGSPVNGFERDNVFAAKLDAGGALHWNTFLGRDSSEESSVAVSSSGDIYLTGTCNASWGSPLNPYNGGLDAFVARLDSAGALRWHTFLGSSSDEAGFGITTDNNGNIYVTGYPQTLPMRKVYADYWDSPFVAKLKANGILEWNTFLGGSSENSSRSIAVDKEGNIYVTGTWWTVPWNPDMETGNACGFLASLDANGVRQGLTFLGGQSYSPYSPLMSASAYGIAVNNSGKIYVTGYSNSTWGSPVNPYTPTHSDAFVAVFSGEELIPGYEIVLNRDHLYFGSMGQEAPGTQSFSVGSDISAASVPLWFITGDQDWLSYSPASGIGRDSVIVSVNPAGLPAGTHSASITVSDPNAKNLSRTIAVTYTVYGAGQTTPPFGQYSTPAEGSTVYGSVPFTGWALDDTGVESVKIYRQEGNASIYIGDAVFIEGARPDVELAYPGIPMNYRSGWGYMMLTNFLPGSGNGIFTIAAVATDLEGNQVTLGSKTITVDNAHAVKPFGTIDTPGQGGTASGSSYRNWGWVLTPLPNMIPTNGTTIDVWLDGVRLGNPVYGTYRPDVGELFLGYANSDGAGGYFDIDTTTYDNGVHSISWTAVDSDGNEEGLGSRYFLIQNTGNSQTTASSKSKKIFTTRLDDSSAVTLSYDKSVEFSKGYNGNNLPVSVSPDTDGIIRIRRRELERIEIRVSRPGKKIEGYMAVGSRLRSLPPGSTLDKTTGTFSWIPGPGFVGTYRLVFTEAGGKGEKSRKEIILTIVPKFS